ncbi:hypothetical protein CVT24_002504 [Panaeolus cyanescens]|uniref:DUF4110 domain-containing protein n=1 Tax=Panaeolus cyanescens TaxID=181874 RepID=A0A409WBM8_9AGAR|nr:hypothetical protein CVT24_002504 [Panaeolus cyanescens]
MGKKNTSAAAKAAKKAKAAQKVERKETKKATKSKGKGKSGGNDSDTDTEDLEAILDKMRKEWEAAHTVTEELVEGPPTRRANASLTACPNGNHLWCIGGEFFSEDGKAYFYNDVFRYTPEKDEWRKFVSQTCPGPRSAHAVVGSPAGGGKLFLFGGEFSSLHQNSFHHYRDFWVFDIPTHSWDRIETKIRPSARSGHRMAVWKHLIVLFGGFYDPGITTRYLNDLWIFDTQEYKWMQIELKENDAKPSPRSGFSFLPCAEGIVLHGGYCKEYAKGKRPVGVMLEDTWLLKINLPSADAPPSTPTASKSSQSLKAAPSSSKTGAKSKAPSGPAITVKWERRKRASDAYAPSLRSGCTMALWANKAMGILFGGVTDEDTSEETLESVFHNDLYGYHLTGKGKWISMALKKPKAKGAKVRGGGGKKKGGKGDDKWGDSDDEGAEYILDLNAPEPTEEVTKTIIDQTAADDPLTTVPLQRYNAMLAVLRNTVYIYGGIYERGSKEYTLDDFYSLQLDKLDRFQQLEDVVEEEIVEDVVDDELRSKATAFMGVSKDTARSAEDVQSTPLPGETLAMFYARSREYWTQKAVGNSDNRGKQLRRDGFAFAKERYAEYKPILEEVEKILAEAGLDEEEMRRGAAGGPQPAGGAGQSRNRR